jgi:hypothetical protein
MTAGPVLAGGTSQSESLRVSHSVSGPLLALGQTYCAVHLLLVAAVPEVRFSFWPVL